MTVPVRVMCGSCGYVYPEPPPQQLLPFLRTLGLFLCRVVLRCPLSCRWRWRIWQSLLWLLLCNGGPHLPHTDPSYHRPPPPTGEAPHMRPPEPPSDRATTSPFLPQGARFGRGHGGP